MATTKIMKVAGRPAKFEDGVWTSTYWWDDRPVVHTIECTTLDDLREKIKAAFEAEPLDAAFNGWSLTVKPMNGRWAPGFKRLSHGLWLRAKAPVAA